MKNRLLYILTGSLLVITLIVLLRDKNSTLGRKESEVGFQNPGSISTFSLAGEGKLLRFNRMDQGWLLNDSFPVKPGLADIFLSTLSTMQVKAPLPRKQWAEVADSARKKGVETRLYRGSACIRAYFTWNHAGQAGTYLLQQGARKPVLVEIPELNGEPARIFRIREEYWKDQVVFNLPLQRMSVLRVQELKAGGGFQIRRAGIDQAWQLSNLHDSLQSVPVDQLALGELLQSLHRIPYLRCVTSDRIIAADSLRQTQPTWTIRMKGFRGEQELLRIYQRPLRSGVGKRSMPDPDLAWAWLENSKQLVLVKYSELDNLLLNPESLTKH